MLTVGAAVLGLVVGSFLNVCIHRWPRGQSVVAPRSRCPRCSSPIAWHDNIPLLSFALLRGRCRDCRAPIARRYPLVEVACAALFGMLAWQFGLTAAAGKLALLASMLLILLFTDLEHMILPDLVTLGGLGIGVALSAAVPPRSGLADLLYWMAGVAPPAAVVSLSESVLAAALFGGGLYLLGELFYRWRGAEGLGLGDVKLVAMIASFQGAAEALLVMIGASLLATVCGSAAVLAGRKEWRDPLPFGSYIAAVAILLIFVGETVLDMYWGFTLG